MTLAERLPAMPFDRSGVLELAPTYRVLQGEEPISRVRTPAGDVAWLATGYEVVKELFTDDRLGRAHPDPDRAPRFSNSFLFLGGSVGTYETEKADHARMRRVLTRSFMVKRMNELRPAISAIVDEALDRMTAMTPPVDLHAEFSFVVPVMAICQLLGVPNEDRARFGAWTQQSMNMWDREKAAEGHRLLATYMHGLIQRKREAPAEDVISDLLTAQQEEDHFTERDMIQLCVALLMAGHETTVARIDLGALLLLTHPDQLDALRRDPRLATGAVEEILRLAAPTLGVIARYAVADIDIAGVTIAAGDLVLISTDAANRDGAAFDDPDSFDIRRAHNQHVAFGHGLRFCIGAGLARVELQTVFGRLFQRVPMLRLAAPIEELRLRDDTPLGGLTRLPVTW
jgi:pentalenolactone synthase